MSISPGSTVRCRDADQETPQTWPFGWPAELIDEALAMDMPARVAELWDALNTPEVDGLSEEDRLMVPLRTAQVRAAFDATVLGERPPDVEVETAVGQEVTHIKAWRREDWR